ncbi:MAG: hypothetical protein ACRBBN_04285 [Methyloligellaceae bacterium]
MNFILNRLKEPSTFAGIAAVFASFGLLDLSESQWNEFFGAVAALAGLAAVVLEEKNNEDEDL